MVGCFLGGILGAVAYLFFIEMHHSSEDDGETGYQLESIVTTKVELKSQEIEMGKGNMSFDDGVVANGK